MGYEDQIGQYEQNYKKIQVKTYIPGQTLSQVCHNGQYWRVRSVWLQIYTFQWLILPNHKHNSTWLKVEHGLRYLKYNKTKYSLKPRAISTKYF